MAYEQDILDKEGYEEEGMDQIAQPMSGAVQSTPAQSGQAAPSGRKPAQQTGSGMFTNIQKYYAQPTAEAAKKMATKVGEGYQNRFQNIQDNVQQKFQGFQDEAQPEIQKLQTAGDRVKQYLQQAGTGVAPEVEQQRIAELRKLEQGVYENPTELDLSGELLQQQNLKKELADPSSEQTTRQALKSVYERPTYFQGMRNLDYLLMRQKGAQDELRSQADQVNQQIESSNIEQQQQDRYQNDVDRMGQLAARYRDGGDRSVRQAYTDAEQQMRESIMSRAEAEKQRRLDLGREINPYITGYGNLSEGDLINQQDIAKANALSRLSGSQVGYETPVEWSESSVRDQLNNNTERSRLLAAMNSPFYSGDVENINNTEAQKYITPEGLERGSQADIENFIKQTASIYDPNVDRGIMIRPQDDIEGSYGVGDINKEIVAKYLADQENKLQTARQSGYEVDDSFLRNISDLYKNRISSKYQGYTDSDIQNLMPYRYKG